MGEQFHDQTAPDPTQTAKRLLRGHGESPAATNEIHDWLAHRSAEQRLEVERVPFSTMERWSFHPEDGRLAHDSGRFFSVEGLHVSTNVGRQPEWIQPILVQPEIGFLGLIVREVDGVMQALVQAKAEPGNLNAVQLSPTVQATRSNYTGVHKGARVRFVEHFDGTRPGRILVDVIQSEHGGCFLRKRNRNMVVEVREEIPEHPNFRWLTLPQLWSMLRHDNLVNMDLRTILACLPTRVDRDHHDELLIDMPAGRFHTRLLHSLIGAGTPAHTMNSLLSWIADMRTRRELVQRTHPLADIDQGGWIRHDDGIEHETKKYFSVFGISVATSDREVSSWMQPVLSPASHGLLALLVKDIDGTLHALIQMRTEAGGLDVAELAPTVHCQPDNYADAPAEYRPAYVDYVLNAPRSQIRHHTWQSEEGGRFYQNENRYMLVEVPDDFDDSVTPDHRWMSFDQLTYLLSHSYYVNVQLRSLIACAHASYGRATE